LSLLSRDCISPKPRIEFIESHAPGFVETNQEREHDIIGKFQPVSVRLQKRSGNRDSDAFIAVDKWVILRQALP